MPGLSSFKTISNRFKNFILATAFVATQLFVPYIASGTAFASAANLDQCANGAIDSPVTCGAGWSNQDLNAQQSHYRENDSVPFRALLSGLSTSGSHTFTFSWRTTKGGKHAYDYLTTYNRTQAADPCYGVSGCGASSVFPIPADLQVTGAGVTPDSGNFTIFGGSITNVSAYTYTDGTGFSGDKTARLTITFTASQANPVLAWGGHVASQIDWGLGNSAAAISGAPYHMSTNSLDGDSSGKQDRSIQASAILPTPTMSTQVSDSLVTTGTAVTDTATLTGPDSPLTGTVKFFVCGPSGTATGCATGGTQVGSAVSLTEDVIATKNSDAESSAVSAGFTPVTSGVYCFRAEYTPADAAPYSPQDHTNSTSECFTAEAPKGSITIVKDAVPNSAQDFSFTTTGLSTDQTGFKLDDDNDPTLPNTQTFTSLVAGDYGVTESATSGWDFDSVSCTQGASVSKNGAAITIHLAAGENVTCTYKNRQRGTITVHKVTDPKNDTTPFRVTASTSDGNIAGNATRNDLATNNDVVYDVSQGSYSVDEAAASGWSEDDSDCASLTVSYNNLNVVCTIYNTKLAKLTIVKSTLPPSVDQDFSFTTSNLSGNFSLNASSNDTKVFSDLTPGQNYVVNEDGTSGWKLTGLSCAGINFTWDNISQGVSLNLPAGADVTCTFTNTQLGSITGTKFIVNSDKTLASDQTLADGWEVHLCDSNNSCLTAYTDANGGYSFNDLLPETYSIIEVLKDGWTQIFSPSNVDLTAGENSTDNNFGNFQNGSISGYKFNDLNGNGVKDDNEPKLSGWTINLYDDQDQLLASKVTDSTGYDFTNLAPGTYKVCEEGQAGWTQTSTPECYTVNIDMSREQNLNIVFGNQAHGSLTVIKNVDDGFGNLTSDASDWTWDYAGNYQNGNNETAGSTHHVVVPADTYTLNEDQQTNYHFTSVSCTNNGKTFTVDQGESTTVTITAGDNVVCTFTNTRNTGYISVTKYLDPEDDNGLFDLQVNGHTEYQDASYGDTTGDVKVVTGTGNTVSELAGTDTDMSNYDSVWFCYSPDSLYIYGEGTVSDSFAVNSNNQHVYCYFYNVRHATLTVVKDAIPNDPQPFNFTLEKYNRCNEVNAEAVTNLTRLNESCDDYTTVDSFQLVDNKDPNLASKTESLSAADIFSESEGVTYRLTEADTPGWKLTDLTCGDVEVSYDGSSALLTVYPGQNVTCTYTNTKLAKVTVVKDAQPDSLQAFNFTSDLTGKNAGFSLTDSTMLPGNGSKSFDSLMPGTYHISESAVSGWTLKGIDCGDATMTQDGSGITLTVNAGDDITCTFVNTKKPGHVLGAATELPNTGQSGIVNIIAGAFIMSLAIAARSFGRKSQASTL